MHCHRKNIGLLMISVLVQHMVHPMRRTSIAKLQGTSVDPEHHSSSITAVRSRRSVYIEIKAVFGLYWWWVVEHILRKL